MKYQYKISLVILLNMFILGFILSSSGIAQTSTSEDNGRLIAMRFKDADLDNVLDFFSKATGYTIIKDADIKGRVTIISDKDIPIDQALSVLNSILTIKGYSSISNGKTLRIVSLESAKRENTQIKVGTDPDQIEADDTIVTQIMPLVSANAAQIVKDLKDLIPSYGVMVAHTQSNSLILTATSSNIKRFAQIVKELDIPMSDTIKVEVFLIKYRDATNLATVLTNLFKTEGTSTSQQEQARIAAMQRFRGVPGGFGPPGMQQVGEGDQQQTTTDSQILQIRSNVKVVADKDTNSIVVSASKENIDLIKGIIEKLDTQIVGQVETRIFSLQHADATEVADELSDLFRTSTSTSRQTQSIFGRGGFPGQMMGPGGPFQQQGGSQSGTGILGLPEINVVADTRTNSVIVTTTSQQIENIGKLIKQLDVDVSEYGETTIVYPLENANASTLAQVLNNLFQTTAFEQRRGITSISARGGVMGTAAETIESARGLTGNVKIVAETTTNSLIITTYERNIDTLTKIIKELDVILPQVLIEAKIVEVTLDDSSKFGIEWMWEHTTTSSGKNYQQNGTTNFGLSNEVYGLKYAIFGQTIESLLMALEKNTKVNVLSTPKILTVDNKEAVINIGQEVPYLESTQQTNTGLVTSYSYKDVGVILTVTPRINKSGTVSLDVNQQINNLIEFTLFNAPIIAKREASASVTVKDGQTMIIGGIMQDNKTETVNRVPILSSFPFIGNLFKRKEITSTKTELIVFITPHIIRNPEDANHLQTTYGNKLLQNTSTNPDSTISK
ncbi:MAG: type II secretion system secretin GspD [Candidatus Poribacteria bacterium]